MGRLDGPGVRGSKFLQSVPSSHNPAHCNNFENSEFADGNLTMAAMASDHHISRDFGCNKGSIHGTSSREDFPIVFASFQGYNTDYKFPWGYRHRDRPYHKGNFQS